VTAEFNRRIASGQTPKEALSHPIDYPKYRTTIRRVRVIRTDTSPDGAREVRFQSRNGEHVKLLLPDGNAYLEVKGAGRSVSARVVPIADAIRDRHSDPQDGIRRFFKGDTVIDSKDKAVLVVKQIKAAGGGKIILTPVFETRPVRNLKARDGLKAISGSGLNRLVLVDARTPSAASGGEPLPRR
jgi:hypothetical protein